MVAVMREMKDSHVEWIGQIPKAWKCCKQKHEIRLVNGRAYSDSEFEEEGKYRILRVGNLFSNPIWHTSSLELEPDKYCEYGDLLYSWSMSYAPVIWTGEKVIFHYHIWKVQLKNNLDKKFAFYYLAALTDALKAEIHETTMGFITMGIMNNSYIAFPSVDEQQRIAVLLDAKCAEIDALSADIQSEIETMEAYKRSKVFETIAHGVDHADFQETDSDVWRTIPAEWKLVDIKYLFEIVKQIAGKEGYDILAITQQGLKVKDISSNEGQIASDYSGYQFVYPGDFAMNHMDLLTGWVDLSDKFGVTSPDYRVFRLRDVARFDRKFYKYVMQCCYMCRIFYSLGQGVSNLGRWRLQTSAFNNFKIPVPPYEEQVELGNYLDDTIGEIDDIIAQKQEQLAVLADYKKSVIYEYVTGKKEVPAI